MGWLKFFLAPMQDGNFYGAGGTINIGRAVFVFAGGTHTSFERFDPRSNPPGPRSAHQVSDEYNSRVREFATQKGPDFISRLRGHINIRNVNAEAGADKPFMRRAIVLRGLLEKHHFTRKSDDKVEPAMIDEAVMYALLTIDRYQHGVRSMEAILQMCTPIDGRIQIGSLPSRSQLGMHADADDFHIRFHRGRARQNPDPQDLSEELGKALTKARSLGDCATGIVADLEDLRLSLASRPYPTNKSRLKALRNRVDALLRPQGLSATPGSSGNAGDGGPAQPESGSGQPQPTET